MLTTKNSIKQIRDDLGLWFTCPTCQSTGFIKNQNLRSALPEHMDKNETIVVYMKREDTSFSHEFGTEKQGHWECIAADAYVPAIEEWIDVTNHDLFQSKIDHLVKEFNEQNQA